MIWGEEGLHAARASQVQSITPKTQSTKHQNLKVKKKFLKVPRGKKLDYQQKLASRNQDIIISHHGQYLPMANTTAKKRSNECLLMEGHNIVPKYFCQKREHKSDQASTSNYQYTENKGTLKKTLGCNQQNSNWETSADTEFLQEINCKERERDRVGEKGEA